MSAREDFRQDFFGRARRICDAPATKLHGERGRCDHYAKKQLPDGRWVCGTHDPDRRIGWKLCSQAVAWDESGRATRTCKHRGWWWFGGFWYCAHHDPARPRCSNWAAHPPLPSEDVRACWTIDGSPISSHAPKAVRKLFGLRLCETCAKPSLRRVAYMAPEHVPCVLCRGAKVLSDDSGFEAPCLCTEEGRSLANASAPPFGPPSR